MFQCLFKGAELKVNVRPSARQRPISAEGEKGRRPMRGACCVHHHPCGPCHPGADVMSWILKQVAWEALQSASPSASSSALPFTTGQNNKKHAPKGKKSFSLFVFIWPGWRVKRMGVGRVCQAFERGFISCCFFHLFFYGKTTRMCLLWAEFSLWWGFEGVTAGSLIHHVWGKKKRKHFKLYRVFLFFLVCLLLKPRVFWPLWSHLSE